MHLLKDLWRWPSKPVAYPGLQLTDLKQFVDGFLLQLAPGSVFLLERETKPGFLQLVIAERHDQFLKVHLADVILEFCLVSQGRGKLNSLLMTKAAERLCFEATLPPTSRNPVET